MGEFNKDELAALVSKCIGEGLATVEVVEQAYGMLCQLVELETNLGDALAAKDEIKLLSAISGANKLSG